MKIIRTAEEALTVQSMGTYEDNFKNGEIWIFNGQEYYFSHLELSPEGLREYNEAQRIDCL